MINSCTFSFENVSQNLNKEETVELLSRFKKLPTDLKNEILKNSFYIDSIDCVAVVKKIPQDSTNSDSKNTNDYWKNLIEQKRFALLDSARITPFFSSALFHYLS